LIIEPVKTITYFVGGAKQPETTVGQITPIVETPTLYEDVFTDVDSNNKYYTALKYLKDNGVVIGYSDGSFKPDKKINRAEFTKIIIGANTTQEALTNCAANYTKVGDYNVTLFTDVVFAMVAGNEPSWFFDYVCVAKFNGIVKGYDDGSFKPDQNIKFVEASKIIVKVMGSQTPELVPWFMSYIKELAGKNAIPTSITTFSQELTRGEMAEIAYRLRANITNLPSKTYEELQ